ncbi:Cilia- and flagella-associated protein 46, partial [Pleodorina starrii]
QAAQRLGGDIDFWAELLVQYVDCRTAARDSTSAYAREALQGGIAMFLALARDDRSAEKPASAAGAVLRVRLARLLLADMEMLRAQGVSTWRKSYDQAVTLVNQAIMALAAREAGIPHIEALLVQSELMLADPTQLKDLRPRLKKVEKVLTAAEEMAVRFQTDTTPRDLDPRVVTPTARLLARVRCALAEVQLAAAAERERMAAEDREKARPKFPRVRGRDVQVVVDFIDEAGGGPPPPPGLRPEDSALALSTGAAALVAAAPRDRARALLVAGRCLQFKFFHTVPPSLDPRRPFTPPPPPPQAAVSAAASAAASGAASAAATPRGSGNGDAAAEGGGGAAGHAAAAAAATDEGAAALRLQVQAAATLSAAMDAAVAVQDWSLAERSAYELARCYGQQAPGLACRSLALAQACRAAAAGQALLRAAAPPQQPEVLAAAQLDALAAALPVPGDCPHYAALRRVLAGLRGASARLDVAAAPSVERQLLALPPDMRVLCLYFSPDGATLCAAALNIPDPSAQPPPVSDKSRKKLDPAGAGGPPGGGVPRICLLHCSQVSKTSAEDLKGGFRAYRRGVERQIRESISSAAARGVGVVSEETRPASPSKKGGLKQQPSVGGKQRPGSKQGSKVATATATVTVSSSSSGAAAAAAAAAADGPRLPIFDPAINRSWRQLLDQFEGWLAPLQPWLEAALPPLPAGPPPTEGKKAGGGGKDKGAPAGPPKHKVALLLDACLDGLPWEAARHLAAHCAWVGRAPSLQALAACHATATSSDGGAAAAAPDAAAATTAGPPSLSPSPPPPLPPLDLGCLTPIVDPRHECSTPAQARGPYTAPLIPAMTSPELLAALPAAAWWSGFSGEPGRAPSPDLYAGLLGGASGLLFLGVGRFAAHVPPAVLASAELSSCDVALLFDRCNTDGAYWAQLYRDNRKSAEQRRLESPGRVAALLLARGVRTVVVTSCAAPPAVAVKLMTGVLSGLAVGRSVGEAVYGMLTGPALDEFELAHLKANLQVWGAPGLLGQVITQGGKGGKAGAKGQPAKR